MASLKELRKRIDSIKSTQKITSAMKMVAAARLRKAQQMIESSSHYAQNLLTSAKRILQEAAYEELISNVRYMFPKMMLGNGKDNSYLLVVFSSDKGLCGGFNINVAKVAISRIEDLKRQGKEVKVICVGKKAKVILNRKHADYVIDTIEGMASKGADYEESSAFSQRLFDMYNNQEFDICEVITSKFHSAVNREIRPEQVFPVTLQSYLIEDDSDPSKKSSIPQFIAPRSSSVSMSKAASYSSNTKIAIGGGGGGSDGDTTTTSEAVEIKKIEDWLAGQPSLVKVKDTYYDYEPDKMELLDNLVPLIFKATIFQAMVHSQASEHGARMASMDNATRNADDIISKLTLRYNGLRQSAITTELIEIISGAEAI